MKKNRLVFAIMATTALGAVVGYVTLSDKTINQQTAVANANEASAPTQPNNPLTLAEKLKQAKANKHQLSDATLQDKLTVYRDPDCSCCSGWVKHAKQAEIAIEDNILSSYKAVNRIKDQYNVPSSLRSCHTTVSKDGYVFEGHIAVKFIDEFLQNRPKDAVGLIVPGMPVGTPGMEYQDKFLPYQVLLLKQDGSTEVFAEVSNKTAQG